MLETLGASPTTPSQIACPCCPCPSVLNLSCAHVSGHSQSSLFFICPLLPLFLHQGDHYSHALWDSSQTLWGGHDETRRPSSRGVSKRTPTQSKCSSSQSLQDEAQCVSGKGQRRDSSRQKGQRMQGICQNLGGLRMKEGSRGRAQ